uniref:Protein kinase domain-containing protein n=1 Tax=Alexandrium monilatum TaxID=311494 RepID=A0A7S4VGN8_9DINO
MGCLLSSNTGPGVQEAVLPTAPADGTSSASDWGQRDGVKPTWTQKVLCSGADKDIFAGTYQGKSVAICVSKSHGGGWRRIQNEIKVFKALGTHPNIITMHSSGLHEGSLYMVLEVVDPIGFDLDRLKNTYSFAGQTVPSSLMARIVLQLVSALGHMHNKNIIHMDLKTENVLVDGRHNAKLIDMGIAGAVGRRECLRAGYLAPELCEGIRPLSAKVDSWGLGVILHQVYQNQWKLLTNAGQVEMLPGRPATQRPMERPVRDAMFRLLEISPSRRWHLRELQDCEWLWESAVLESAALEAPEDWHKPAAGRDAARCVLRRCVSKLPMPDALAVHITA